MPASDPQAILQSLSGDLMSPYCPGRTIASCPSKSARKLEDEILSLAEEGHSRDEIETQLVARFGAEIIGYEPPPYLLGGVALLATLALGGVLLVGRRWSRRSPSAAHASEVAGPRPPSRAERDALDDALDEEDVL